MSAAEQSDDTLGEAASDRCAELWDRLHTVNMDDLSSCITAVDRLARALATTVSWGYSNNAELVPTRSGALADARAAARLVDHLERELKFVQSNVGTIREKLTELLAQHAETGLVMAATDDELDATPHEQLVTAIEAVLEECDRSNGFNLPAALSMALTEVAQHHGSERLVQHRPGSWEADHIRALDMSELFR